MMWMEIIIHSFIHAIEDTAKLLPFLFLTYLAMEYLEHKAGETSIRLMAKAGKRGPLIGGLLGAVPQCGFSAAAANLYAGRVISMGTMLAVFWSTSDEMLPILISSRVPAKEMLKILGLKIVLGILFGYLADGLFVRKSKEREMYIHGICQQEHCDCQGKGIWKSVLQHCLTMSGFIFLMLFLVHVLTEWIGLERLLEMTAAYPVWSVLLAALLGMIPGCASSVALTTFYLEGILSFGAMMAGLLACSGVGLAILFRMNRNRLENCRIMGLVYGTSVICGLILQLL